jgi:hypothetical protein
MAICPANDPSSAVFFGGEDPVDFDSIRGRRIKKLDLFACRDVTDISPIAGMRLEDVRLWKTGVQDISPLAGMPIRKLVIFGGSVKDLSPLAGMPLEDLWIGATKTTDFSPLKGLPLRHLSLFAAAATDLSPLEGMPLETLNLRVTVSGKITDLSPLKGMKLKRLEFHANTVTKGMDIIRNMESLERINRQTPDEFWQEYESDAPARRRLRKAGIDYRELHVTDDGNWILRFHGDDVRDLSVLKGLPVGSLTLRNGAIRDLSPLRDTEITSLLLENSAVKDLSPLKGASLRTLYLLCPNVDDISPLHGMPLEMLCLDCPKVTDISALHGMPLKTLWISGTDVRDVSPLEGVPLESLKVRIECVSKGIEVLKRMKSLERINYDDVERFWERYDSGEFHRRNAGPGAPADADKPRR